MKKGKWERIPHSIRFIPAECKTHRPYLYANYRRVTEGPDGVGWETKPGKPVYLDKLHFAPHGAGEIRLAVQLIEPLMKVLEGAEKEFGGPPEEDS